MRKLSACLFYGLCVFTIVFSLFWMALPKLPLSQSPAGSETDPASPLSLAAQAVPQTDTARYCLQDSGKIINPQLAEGQMHGGVAMGIGYALGEQMLFDAATGRPLNNNLLDYKIPTCMDIPDMEIRFVETHEDSAPFGAKGLAEPPLIPQAAAVRNAILHATGVGMHKLPMNPQNLVHAFGEAGLIAQ